MIDHRSYVPILRWKRAEVKALEYLQPDIKKRIIPLIEVPPSRFERKRKNEEKVDVDGRLLEITKELYSSLGTSNFFIDFHLVDTEHTRTLNGSHVFEMMSIAGEELGLSCIPVTGLQRDTEYQSIVGRMAREHRRGICLRILFSNIKERKWLANQIERLLAYLTITPEETDLLIDCKLVSNNILEHDIILASIPRLDRWRSLIISAGAFSKDLSGFTVGNHRLARSDWIRWKNIIQQIGPKWSRLPTYSDYTIQHPHFSEPPGPANVSASIRYTLNQNWLIMRGEAMRMRNRDPKRQYRQYIGHALLLMGMPEYCGPTFSYGDKYIHEIGTGNDKTGSAETWLRAGINHHMTFVVRQISSLHGS